MQIHVCTCNYFSLHLTSIHKNSEISKLYRNIIWTNKSNLEKKQELEILAQINRTNIPILLVIEILLNRKILYRPMGDIF